MCSRINAINPTDRPGTCQAQRTAYRPNAAALPPCDILHAGVKGESGRTASRGDWSSAGANKRRIEEDRSDACLYSTNASQRNKPNENIFPSAPFPLVSHG
jgi:hypothetical protein